MIGQPHAVVRWCAALSISQNLQNQLRTLSSVLRSVVCSAALHTSVIAVAYTLPTLSVERFRSFGSRELISIELSFAEPPAAASPAADFEVETHELQEQQRPIAPSPPELTARPRELAVEPAAAMPTEAAELPAPKPVDVAATPRPFVGRPPERAEPPAEVERAAVELREVEPPTPIRRSAASVASPATAAAVPLEQLAGLAEEEVAADLSHNRSPQYPAEAVRGRLEGTVLLRLHIDAAGEVVKVELIRSSGHATLDRAAVEAVGTWQGQPARRGDVPVASVEVLPIRFRL